PPRRGQTHPTPPYQRAAGAFLSPPALTDGCHCAFVAQAHRGVEFQSSPVRSRVQPVRPRAHSRRSSHFNPHPPSRTDAEEGPAPCRTRSRSYFNPHPPSRTGATDRKSTRLNSSHQIISYAVFCL